jgi:hypothetical protein
VHLRFKDKIKEADKLTMKKIYICSPLRGNTKQNIKDAKKYCRYVIKRGFMPIAPHIYFTQFLADDIKKERNLGLKMGMELMELCDELWVFGDQITDGMNKEINYCKKINKACKKVKA